MTVTCSPDGPQKDLQASVTVTVAGDTCVVALSGEIDMSNADGIHGDILHSIDESGCLHLLVDLSGVGFLGSDGIRILVRTYRHVRERGGDMGLRNPAPHIRSVLVITGVNQLLGLA